MYKTKAKSKIEKIDVTYQRNFFFLSTSKKLRFELYGLIGYIFGVLDKKTVHYTDTFYMLYISDIFNNYLRFKIIIYFILIITKKNPLQTSFYISNVFLFDKRLSYIINRFIS